MAEQRSASSASRLGPEFIYLTLRGRLHPSYKPSSPLHYPHAKNPMPDPGTTSPVKPDGVHDPENGDDIQLYDHSDFASSRSGVPFPARSHSRRSNATSTSTERFLRRKGFSAFYYNTVTQVCLLGLVCFLCPGSFNALNGLGAAGRVDSGVNSNSNSALYATFTVAAFFAG